MSHGCLVALKRAEDMPELVARLESEAVQYRLYRSLRRHIHIFTSHSHCQGLLTGLVVEAIDHDDAPDEGAAQEVALEFNLSGGNWGLLRHTNRDAPWATPSPQMPFTGTYDVARTGKGVDVYVIDTGVKTAHPEFGGRATIVAEIISSGGAEDDNGHGTSCASCAAGATIGFARDSEIFSIKVLNSGATGSPSQTVAGMDAALSHYNGRSALNRSAVVSISIRSTSATNGAAAQDLIDAGMVVVAAAANNMENVESVPVYPAIATDVICVGGTMAGDSPYYLTNLGTNWGSRVDILAGASSVYCAKIPDSYERRYGTSFACPQVAGAIACMLQGYRRLTTRAEVQAVRSYVMAQATTGRLVQDGGPWSVIDGFTIPDRILYLEPSLSAPAIDGLTLLMRPEAPSSRSSAAVLGRLDPRTATSRSTAGAASVTARKAAGVAGQGSVAVAT